MRVRQHAFAKDIIGCSLKMVSTWRAEGMPTDKGGVGEIWIETSDAIPWLLNRYKATNSRRPEKERLSKESADSKAYDNAERRKDLVKFDFVKGLLTGVISEHASELEALAGRISHAVTGVSDPARVRQLVLGEVRAVRSTLAQRLAKLAEHAPDSVGPGEADGAATGQDAGRVGRRKPGPSARKRNSRQVEE